MAALLTFRPLGMGSAQAGKVRLTTIQGLVMVLPHFRCTSYKRGSDTLFLLVYAAARTRWRSRSKLARPYICRFTSLSLLIRPSTGPVLHGKRRAAATAAWSRAMLSAKPRNSLQRAAAIQGSRASVACCRIIAAYVHESDRHFHQSG